LREYAESQSLLIELQVTVDEDVADEAFAAALSSALYHQIKIEELSYLKELAHLGFWVAELKPVSISDPLPPEEYVKWASHATDGAIPILDPSPAALESFDRALALRSKFATYSVNELVALDFICMSAEAAACVRRDELQAHDNANDGSEALEVAERAAYFRSKLHGPLYDDLAMGLRFHGFTPRAFATLIEAIFAFEGF